MTQEMHPRRWGHPSRVAELGPEAAGLIELAFGVQATAKEPDVGEPGVPPESTLPAAALEALHAVLGENALTVAGDDRALRTRGKSTPDLLRARAGDLTDAPDAVVRPADGDQVAALIDWAVEHRVALTPFGGGTAVTGGLAVDSADRSRYAGVVSVDLCRMKRLIAVDTESMTATLEPGLRGPEAEALLAEQGLILGHFPQSFEYASIGGFAATRSSGQSSAGYGRFDAMVVGLVAETPTGRLELGSSPANAAGPDLRQVILGSEGAFGIITAVTVRVRRAPEVKEYEGWWWPGFAEGAAAMRRLAQAGELPTVIRLSDETETAINLADPAAIGGDGEQGGCLMIVGHEGTAAQVAERRARTTARLEEFGGRSVGTGPGESWAHGRFDAPYLRDSLFDAGVLVETLETATFWSNVPTLYAAVAEALKAELGDQTIVLCHISHVYETGCSLYFTVAAPMGDRPIERWYAAKAAASDAIRSCGATITHHHAIGQDHKTWLADEIGPVGVRILRSIKQGLDPHGVLNPGVLVP